MIFVGDDWAEAHHDVYLMRRGRRPAGVAATTRGHRGRPRVARAHRRLTPTTPARWWSGSRPTGACGSRRWSRPAIRCTRSTRWRRRATATATPCRAPSPIRVTPRCWPSWCAPTGTTTARSPATATSAEAIKVLARAHQNLIWDTHPAHQPAPQRVCASTSRPRWTPSTTWPTATPWRCWRRAPTPAEARELTPGPDPHRAQTRWPATQHRHPRPGDRRRRCAPSRSPPRRGRRRVRGHHPSPGRDHRRAQPPDRRARDRAGRPF